MHTLTVEVNDDSKALKTLHELEAKHFIKIVDSNKMETPALPGKKLNLQEFRNWIKNAEETPTIPLKEAMAKWAGKRKQLQNLIK